MLVHRLAEHFKLIFKNLAVRHVGSIVEQRVDVQVNLKRSVLVFLLLVLNLVAVVSLGCLLCKQSLLDVVGIGIYGFLNHIVLDDVVD